MEATLTESGGRYTLGFERHLAHAPQKVWRVLTERELLSQWFPCEIEGEWEVGAPLRFEFLHGEGDDLPDDQLRGEVLAVDPYRLLEFRWGDSVIRCELLPEDEGCRLLFSEVLPGPSWGARSAAGWEMCLENLELVVQGGTIARFAWNQWRGRFDRYVAQFEPVHGPQDEPPEDFRPE